MGKNIAVVVGHNGLDEVSTTGENTVSFVDNQQTFSPSDFGIDVADDKDLAGGNVLKNTDIALEILSGDNINTPKTGLVAANVAMTLKLLGHADNLGEGVSIAKQALKNGDVMRKFEEYKVNSQLMVNNE